MADTVCDFPVPAAPDTTDTGSFRLVATARRCSGVRGKGACTSSEAGAFPAPGHGPVPR